MRPDARVQAIKMYGEMIAFLKAQKKLLEDDLFATRDETGITTSFSIAMCDSHIAELEDLMREISSTK
jgi:hypothetical protein